MTDAEMMERLKDPVFRAAFNSRLAGLRARREALADGLDAYEHADPPVPPPEALVREYYDVGEQIEAAHRAEMGPPRIELLDVAPLSSGTSLAFVDGPGLHGMVEIATHTYPKNPRGKAAQKFRREHRIKLGDLARALCIGVADASGLERGSKTTDDAGWTEIQTTLFLLGSGKKPEHVADPRSDPSFLRALESCENDAPDE